jgi:hypothetical protein
MPKLGRRLEPRGRTGPSRGARRRERRRKGKVRRGEEGESEWMPGENGRDDPANEAREKSKGEKELNKGEGERRLSEGERREPREKATVAAKALRIDPGRERENQQPNERTTEEELRARKEKTSQVGSMRREEGQILTPSPKSAGADSLLPCISKSLPPSCPSCPRGTSSSASPVHRLGPRGEVVEHLYSGLVRLLALAVGLRVKHR